MKTEEIAEKLVTWCREGNFNDCYAQLYSPDCVSLEPKGANMEVANGMEEMKKKGEMWNSMVEEMHSASVSDPIVSENYFSVRMTNDITFKETGRQVMDEICMYEVRDGKIVKEQFFY
jgi:hypothetical protein